MTLQISETIVKVGPKGQVLLKKRIRDAVNISAGSMVLQKITRDGILIKPIRTETLLSAIDELAQKIGKSQPKSVDCVELVSRERK